MWVADVQSSPAAADHGMAVAYSEHSEDNTGDQNDENNGNDTARERDKVRLSL